MKSNKLLLWHTPKHLKRLSFILFLSFNSFQVLTHQVLAPFSVPEISSKYHKFKTHFHGTRSFWLISHTPSFLDGFRQQLFV